jgi:esterase
MDNRLHDSVLGDGPDVVLLHGLFGQGSNLGSIARALQAEFKVHSPDLPDHGHSPWSERPCIESYAQAIAGWMDERHIPMAHFVGHSLGGKVAMQLALSEPARVDRLVVSDIAPVAYPASHDAVLQGLQNVAQAQCASRRDAAEILRQTVSDEGVVQFLLLSLKRDENPFCEWRLNHRGIAEAYERFREALEADTPFDGETLFIHGELSDYVLPEHEPTIARLFSHYRFEVVPAAGHWLHAEQPAKFNQAVLDFLL